MRVFYHLFVGGKKLPKKPFSHSAYAWLGLYNLFQTFEDLESVKDKQTDILSVRQLLDDDTDSDGPEAPSC
jgi:hypothetical protein